MGNKVKKRSSRLRVMFFEDGELGGSVVCLEEMINGLAALGCEVGLVSLYKRTIPVELGSIDCVRFWRCLDLPPQVRPRPEVAVRTLGIPRPTIFAMRYFVVALRALRRFQPDIAYFNNEIESSIPAAIATKLLGIPTVCHLRIARGLHPIERVFAKIFDQLIVLTKAGHQMVLASGIPEQKLTQIYDPFDVLTFVKRTKEALSVNIPWDNNCVYVIQVGTLTTRKRPMLALDAFAYARAQCSKLRLILVGSGPLRDALEQAIQRRGLDGSVHLIGYCLQIPALLSHCDIGLFVSASEGLGLVILESTAAGLPVVTWNMPVFEELVVNGETGIIVQNDDAENFGEALVKLYKSAELRKRLGRNGRRSINEDSRFHPETHIRRIHDLLLANVRKHKHLYGVSVDNIQS